MKTTYTFGPFELDLAARRLLRSGKPVLLASRAFDTLAVLVANHGRVVTKRELMEAVWPGTFVEENNLNQSISTLRRSLGNGSDEERYIATVPRRGYCFVAPVRDLGEVTTAGAAVVDVSPAAAIVEPEASPAKPVLSKRIGVRAWAVLGLVCVVVLVAAGIGYLPRREVAITGVRSIAVLPFRSLGPDRLDEYLRLGLADAVITRLGYAQKLEVRPTGSVRSFLDGPADPVAAGRALGVDAVLEGQIQRSGDRTRVTVQLVGVRQAATVWSKKFDVRSGDLFEIEDTISNAVTRAVVSGLSEGEKLLLARRRVTTPDAYEAYLKGRYYWNRRTQESFRKGVDAFRRAIVADPEYAPAYAGLADSYNFLGQVPEAKKAAGRALELDATLAEAHAALGNAALFYDFRRAEAGIELRRAIDLSPSYATAHQWLAYDLAAAGRFDQAITEIRRARDLDPVSLSIATDVGDILYYARRYDEALRECRKAIEMDPHFLQAHLTLGRILEEKGEIEAAIRELSDDELIGERARAYAIAGSSAEAMELLERLPGSYSAACRHWERARVFASLGEKDRAFEWLERAYKARYGALILLKVDPQFDSLRTDTRFASLIRRIGLES